MIPSPVGFKRKGVAVVLGWRLDEPRAVRIELRARVTACATFLGWRLAPPFGCGDLRIDVSNHVRR